LISIDWAGCGIGLVAKFQELLIQAKGENGVDQTLFIQRNDLVKRWVEITYSTGRYDVAMLLRGHKHHVNQELGLGMNGENKGWGNVNENPEIISFVLSNYTPFWIYQQIFEYMERTLRIALEEDDMTTFRATLEKLGYSQETTNEKYFDPITQKYDFALITSELPLLVISYAIREKYIKWGRNQQIVQDMKELDYQNQQKREQGKQIRRLARIEAQRRAAELELQRR
jgi:hypothetical protein